MTGDMAVRPARRASRGGPRTGRLPPPVLVLGAITSVQVGAALARRLFSTVGPTGAVALRLAFAAVVLVAIARPRLRGTSRRALGTALVFGLVLLAMNWSFYEALSRVPLGAAVTVEFVGPLCVAVAGSRRLLDGVWVALAAAGVVLLAGGGSSSDVGGLALALLAGGFWAAYILLSQRVGAVLPGLSGLAVGLAAAALVMAPVGVVLQGGSLFGPTVLLAGFGVAMLSSAIPYSLELAALRDLPAAVFGVLMSLEPAVAALAGLVVLGQRLRSTELVAIGLVVVASLGSTLGRHGAASPPGVTPERVG